MSAAVSGNSIAVPARKVKVSSRFTIGVWVALIVLFVVFFQIFSAEPHDEPPPMLLVLAVFFGVLGLFVVALIWRGRRFSRTNHEGLAHLGAGDAQAALEAFRRAEKRATAELNAATAVYNQAVAHLVRGELLPALGAFEAVGRARSFAMMGALYQSLPNHLAACRALLGDVPGARAQLQEGVRRRSDSAGMYFLLPEMVVLCREGHFAAALKLLEQRWLEAELTGGVHLKLLRILRAYTLEATHGEAARGDVERWLLAAEPIEPVHRQMLGATWPELRAFLDRAVAVR